MAWYTEQAFVDFLNHDLNHVGASKMLLASMEDDVVLLFGEKEYRGKTAVFDFFEEMYNVVTASENGFTAFPITTKDQKGNHKTGFALFSKLEIYVSWIFRVRASTETWLINEIKAERPDTYELFFDLYQALDYDNEGNSFELENAHGDPIFHDYKDLYPQEYRSDE